MNPTYVTKTYFAGASAGSIEIHVTRIEDTGLLKSIVLSRPDELGSVNPFDRTNHRKLGGKEGSSMTISGREAMHFVALMRKVLGADELNWVKET